MPTFPVLFPFPDFLTCSLKEKQINSRFLYIKKLKSLHDRITYHESEDELQKLLYDFGESVLRTIDLSRVGVSLWEM